MERKFPKTQTHRHTPQHTYYFNITTNIMLNGETLKTLKK